jgi:hypothetical protein
MPTIAQSLWLSTKVSTGNLTETRTVVALDEKIDRMFLGTPPELKAQYKINEAIQFIKENPGTYTRMALRKLVSFWFPWAFTDTWSTPHRVVDALLSIALAVGLVLAWRTRIDTAALVLIALVTALFAVLSAFSQIDPDGRYRVPAELPLLLVVPAGWLYLINPQAFGLRSRSSHALDGVRQS